MTRNSAKAADQTFIGMLIAVAILSMGAYLIGLGGWVFAVANLAIVAGYLYTAAFIAPHFKVDCGTQMAAVLFFVTCAGTHIELAVHQFTTSPLASIKGDDAYFDSWHLVVLHAVQASSILRFVYGLLKAAIIEQETLKDLVEAAENEHKPNPATIQKAREAL